MNSVSAAIFLFRRHLLIYVVLVIGTGVILYHEMSRGHHLLPLPGTGRCNIAFMHRGAFLILLRVLLLVKLVNHGEHQSSGKLQNILGSTVQLKAAEVTATGIRSSEPQLLWSVVVSSTLFPPGGGGGGSARVSKGFRSEGTSR